MADSDVPIQPPIFPAQSDPLPAQVPNWGNPFPELPLVPNEFLLSNFKNVEGDR